MQHILFLQAAAPGGASSWGPLVMVMVVFFVFMILPQMRRNKEAKKFKAAIEKGDKVILVAGIHGKIIEIQDSTYIIETENQGRLKVDQASVSVEATKAAYPKEKA